MHIEEDMSTNNAFSRSKISHFLMSSEIQMIDFIAAMSKEHKAYLVAVYTEGTLSTKDGTRVYATLEQALEGITKQFNNRVKDRLRVINLFVYTTNHKLIESYQVYRRE